MAEAEETPDAYDRLVEHLRRYVHLGNAGEVLGWDQQVMMPEGGQPARAAETAAVESAQHERLTDDRVGEWLDALESRSIEGDRAATVREVRREYDREAPVPESLVEELSVAQSDAREAWERAREADDWSAFAPHLETIVELKREYAGHVDPDADPYAVLFADYEPWLDLEVAEDVLGELADALPDLIDDVADSEVAPPEPFDGTYPESDQASLVRAVLEDVGYDFQRGRLDVAAHPFTSGNRHDARVTTRYHEDDPLDGLMAAIHEFGHASYTQGLPEADFGEFLGEDRGLTVHESQSRFWENHVGRSRAFWTYLRPAVEEHLGVSADAEALYRRANQVYDDNLIRVEADELTYHLHVVLRFEVERALVAGDLAVEDVPAAWNDKMESYLGLRPETDAAGALQDVHWSLGYLGYFPTYTLGSVLAAQLDAAMREDLAVDARIREGEFGALTDWHGRAIHRHGTRHRTGDLIERATGDSLSAEPFLAYVREKYGALYDL